MGKGLDRCSAFQLKKCPREKHLPEDRLSSLPDDILLFILSFVTYEEVVKTSLLSRRWLKLWMHTLVLQFHAPVSKATLINDMERQNYVNWVSRDLLRHKGQCLKEFKIVCDLDKRNQKDIDDWLVIALAKKVQCMELNLLNAGCNPSNMKDNYVFPSQFFNVGSGQANLDGGKRQFLKFDFECLKSLSLKSVDVTGEIINFFLGSCPFLERVEVIGTLKLVSLVISDPTLVLKYLKINYCYNLKVLSISDFNLVSLDISAVGDLTLRNLPMLVELFIEGASNKFSHCVAQASSCFSQLEALTLTATRLEDVTQLSNYDQLTKLKRLVIEVGALGDESLTKLISIINYCTHLEEFVLMMSWFDPKPTRSRIICDLERCNSSLKSKSLKIFEFWGYCGRVSDVELIMHVVKNAVGLEKIIIDPRNILLTGLLTFLTPREEEARRIALEQFDSLREAIPPHVHLIIC